MLDFRQRTICPSLRRHLYPRALRSDKLDPQNIEMSPTSARQRDPRRRRDLSKVMGENTLFSQYRSQAQPVLETYSSKCEDPFLNLNPHLGQVQSNRRSTKKSRSSRTLSKRFKAEAELKQDAPRGIAPIATRRSVESVSSASSSKTTTSTSRSISVSDLLCRLTSSSSHDSTDSLPAVLLKPSSKPSKSSSLLIPKNLFAASSSSSADSPQKGPSSLSDEPDSISADSPVPSWQMPPVLFNAPCAHTIPTSAKFFPSSFSPNFPPSSLTPPLSTQMSILDEFDLHYMELRHRTLTSSGSRASRWPNDSKGWPQTSRRRRQDSTARRCWKWVTSQEGPDVSNIRSITPEDPFLPVELLSSRVFPLPLGFLDVRAADGILRDLACAGKGSRHDSIDPPRFLSTADVFHMINFDPDRTMNKVIMKQFDSFLQSPWHSTAMEALCSDQIHDLNDLKLFLNDALVDTKKGFTDRWLRAVTTLRHSLDKDQWEVHLSNAHIDLFRGRPKPLSYDVLIKKYHKIPSVLEARRLAWLEEFENVFQTFHVDLFDVDVNLIIMIHALKLLRQPKAIQYHERRTLREWLRIQLVDPNAMSKRGRVSKGKPTYLSTSSSDSLDPRLPLSPLWRQACLRMFLHIDEVSNIQ